MSVSNILATSTATLAGLSLCFQSLEIVWERDIEEYACSSLDTALQFGSNARWSGSISGCGYDLEVGAFDTLADASGALSVALKTASSKTITFSGDAFVTNLSLSAPQRDVPTFDISFKGSDTLTTNIA